ncbi:ISKra4 family transposase [Nonomuraea sp. NPDC050310]|uniref:ISKra4 family transposase n=1 Tax=Nonomuraea sp. NPDC050310 TaxID=3154935 RepID=UPI0033ED1994
MKAVDTARHCQQCGRTHARKDTRTIVLRTESDTLRLDSPRLKTCPCTPSMASATAATFSPVAAAMPERTAPELLLWEAKYAALTSYGNAATLLAETFPLGRPLHATSIRQQVERTATHLEDELGDERFSSIDTCPRDLETVPRPDLPLVVALDGGYVHSANQTSRRDGWFEAVTGCSTPTGGGPAKTFAFVQTYDHKLKRRVYELLRSQGMTDNQQIVFLVDGGEDIRDLPCYLIPQAEHYLDWFHITMRLTVLRQSTRSLPAPPADVADFTIDPSGTDRILERIKNYLWHGNTFRALHLLNNLVEDYELLCAGEPDDKRCAFYTRLAEFHTYIDRNQHEIPNYGERHRNGEAISSATAEATVNHVISRRMVKKQRMRWTPRGAHRLLQIRTRVLNRDLDADFACWYPNSDQALSLVA